MTFMVSLNYNALINNIIHNMCGVNKWRRDFFIEVLWLFLGIKGHINFMQLSRYGRYSEQRYRQQFEKPFDFLQFNKSLVIAVGSGTFAIGFDPSYISKSDNHTHGLGYFWSGCASKALWGLEIGGIATIDLGLKTAFHLEAVQTPNKKELDTKYSQMEWYANLLVQRREALLEISPYLVVDAYSSKKGFVDTLTQPTFHVISRLQDDADLRYINPQIKTGKRGRPKKYGGKIDPQKPDMAYFEKVVKTRWSYLYCAKVHSKALKKEL